MTELKKISKSSLNFDVVIHVSLPSTDPPVWRRIRVAADVSLFHLAYLLEPVMGWEAGEYSYVFNDPLDGAVFGPKVRFTADHLSIEEFQGPIYSSTGNGLIDAQRVYVGQLLRQAGDWIVWTHGLE